MNLINPPALFSGGDVSFDSTPYRVAYQKAQASKFAKNEAMDKYFNDLNRTINSAGLLQPEIEGVNKQLGELQKYGIGNKGSIAKGGAAKYNIEQQARDIHSYIDIGKQKVKDLSDWAALKKQKGTEYIFADPTIHAKIEKASLPVGQGYEPFSVADAQLPGKPFDDAAHTKRMQIYKPKGEKIVTLGVDPNDNTKDIIQRIPDYKQEQIEQIRLGALSDYHSDEDNSYKRKVDAIIADPAQKEEYAKIYKAYTGEDAATPEDYAAAFDLSKIQNKPETIKRETNNQRGTAHKDAIWGAHNRLTYAQSMRKISVRKNKPRTSSSTKKSDKLDNL